MSVIAESWDPIAKALGYETEREMLQDLYEIQGFSVSELSKRLGYAQNNVRRRLMFNDIPLRSRGGRNNRGGTRLAKLSDAELAKDARVLAHEQQVHISTIFRERRIRQQCNSAQSSPPTPSSTSESESGTSVSPSTATEMPIETSSEDAQPPESE